MYTPTGVHTDRRTHNDSNHRTDSLEQFHAADDDIPRFAMEIEIELDDVVDVESLHVPADVRSVGVDLERGRQSGVVDAVVIVAQSFDGQRAFLSMSNTVVTGNTQPSLTKPHLRRRHPPVLSQQHDVRGETSRGVLAQLDDVEEHAVAGRQLGAE